MSLLRRYHYWMQKSAAPLPIGQYPSNAAPPAVPKKPLKMQPGAVAAPNIVADRDPTYPFNANDPYPKRATRTYYDLEDKNFTNYGFEDGSMLDARARYPGYPTVKWKLPVLTGIPGLPSPGSMVPYIPGMTGVTPYINTPAETITNLDRRPYMEYRITEPTVEGLEENARMKEPGNWPKRLIPRVK